MTARMQLTQLNQNNDGFRLSANILQVSLYKTTAAWEQPHLHVIISIAK